MNADEMIIWMKETLQINLLPWQKARIRELFSEEIGLD